MSAERYLAKELAKLDNRLLALEIFALTQRLPDTPEAIALRQKMAERIAEAAEESAVGPEFKALIRKVAKGG